MSLQIAAQHLASKGRGPDTMLVHMAPGEVNSLQALARAHGGTLTTNPDTGLPEAGFLSSILPMVAGAALAPLTAGTSLAFLGTPMGAALTVGGLQALRTGSLQKGLMAGLGAYSGAGIGDVIGKAGTAAIEAGATGAAPALPPVTDAVPTIVAPPVAPVAPVTPPGVTVGGPMNMALPQATPVAPLPPAYPAGTLGSGAFDPMGGGVLNTGAATPLRFGDVGVPTAPNVTPMPTAPVTPPPVPNVPNQLDLMSDRAAALREAGPMGRFTKGLGAIADKPSLLFNKENLKYGAAGLGSLMLQEPKSVQAPRDTEQYRYAYSPGPAMPPTRMGDVGEYTYFRPSYTRLAADGGIMSALPVQQMSDRNDAEMMALNRSQMFAEGGSTALDRIFDRFLSQFPAKEAVAAPSYEYNYDPATQMYTQQAAAPEQGSAYGRGVPGMFNLIMERTQARARNSGVDPVHAASGGQLYAKGGISHLGDYSDGGRLLRGPGDGVSDDIPATIANKRPARLADGEFVVPARIVSELGNGSTDAGARKLYAMMDRIQQRRAKTIGKGKVAVNSRAEKLLPA